MTKTPSHPDHGSAPPLVSQFSQDSRDGSPTAVRKDYEDSLQLKPKAINSDDESLSINSDDESLSPEVEVFQEPNYDYSFEGKSITPVQCRKRKAEYDEQKEQKSGNDDIELPSRPKKRKKKTSQESFKKDDMKYDEIEQQKMREMQDLLVEHNCDKPYVTPSFKKILFNTGKTLYDQLFQNSFLCTQVLNHLADEKHLVEDPTSVCIKSMSDDMHSTIRALVFPCPGHDDFYMLLKRTGKLKKKKARKSKTTRKSNTTDQSNTTGNSKIPNTLSLADMWQIHGFKPEWDSWREKTIDALKNFQIASPGGVQRNANIQDYGTILRYVRCLLSLVYWYTNHIEKPPTPENRGPTDLQEGDVIFYFDPAKPDSRNALNNYAVEMESFFVKLLKASTYRSVVQLNPEKLDKCLKLKRGEWLTNNDHCQVLEKCAFPANLFDVEGKNFAKIVRRLWNKMQVVGGDEVKVYSTLDFTHESLKVYIKDYWASNKFYEEFLVHLCECHFVLPVFEEQCADENTERLPGGKVLLTCNHHTLPLVTQYRDTLQKHYRISIVTNDDDTNDDDALVLEMQRYRTPLEVYEGKNDDDGNVIMIPNPDYDRNAKELTGSDSDSSPDETYVNPLPANNPIWKILLDWWYRDMVLGSSGTEDPKELLCVHGKELDGFIQDYVLTKFSTLKRQLKLEAEVFPVFTEGAKNFRLREAKLRNRNGDSDSYVSNDRLHIVGTAFFESQPHFKSEEMLPKPEPDGRLSSYSVTEQKISILARELMKRFPDRYFREIVYLPESEITAKKIVTDRFFEVALPQMVLWSQLPPEGKLFVPLTQTILELVIKHEENFRDKGMHASIVSATGDGKDRTLSQKFNDLNARPVDYVQLKSMECMKSYLVDGAEIEGAFGWLSFENKSTEKDRDMRKPSFSVPWTTKSFDATALPSKPLSMQDQVRLIQREKKLPVDGLRTASRRPKDYNATEFATLFKFDGPIYLRRKDDKGTLVLKPKNTQESLRKLCNVVSAADVLSPKFETGQIVRLENGTNDSEEGDKDLLPVGVISRYHPEVPQSEKVWWEGRRPPQYDVWTVVDKKVVAKCIVENLIRPEETDQHETDKHQTFAKWLNIEQPSSKKTPDTAANPKSQNSKKKG